RGRREERREKRGGGCGVGPRREFVSAFLGWPSHAAALTVCVGCAPRLPLGEAGAPPMGKRGQAMTVTVCMDEAGAIWIANGQGAILAECFFKTEDETEDELRHMGYH